MNLLNKNILRQSDFVQDIYVTQTKVFSSIEYPYLLELITKNNIKSILDVGTGEGNFISGLAINVPEIEIVAVDGDKKLIHVAKEKNQQKNITFINQVFDKNFKNDSYDMILARFAVEHMTNIEQFISEAVKRLNRSGILVITEYYCEFVEEDNEIWKLFRNKEIEMYYELGSKPRSPIIIPKEMKKNGLNDVDSVFIHLTPSTIGHDNFYKIIISYAIGYANMAPEIFTEEIQNKIIDYCIDVQPDNENSEDRLFLTHSIGIKK